MIIPCPKCNAKLNVKEEAIGRRVQCAACRHYFPVQPPPGHKPAAPAPAPAPAPAADDAPAKPKKKRSLPKMPGMVPLGKIMILVGLSAVLLARGCDGVAARSEGRYTAKIDRAKTEFKNTWDEKIQDARENSDTAAVRKLGEQRLKEQQDLEDGDWKDMSKDATFAQFDRKINAYWLQWLSVVSSIVLAIGLLLVGFYGDGAERTVCLIMLAIITFALFVGGASFRFG